MQVDVQRYLDLVENSKTLAFYDIEATGLRGDYNSVLVVSIKPINEKAISFKVKQPGNDQKLVREVKEELSKYDIICGYYSKGYDWPMLNTRLLKWGFDPLNSVHHIDMYYTLKHNILTSRRSQGHLLSWLEAPEQKMTVSADVWNDIIVNPAKNLKTMVDRCESDVAGLEELYKRTKHLIKDIKKS